MFLKNSGIVDNSDITLQGNKTLHIIRIILYKPLPILPGLAVDIHQMRVVGHPQVVQPGPVGAVRPVDCVHLRVYCDHGAGGRQTAPVRVLDRLLRHRRFCAAVDERLAAVAHDHSFAAEQHKIFVFKIKLFKVTDTFAFQIIHLPTLSLFTVVVGQLGLGRVAGHVDTEVSHVLPRVHA